MQSKKKNLNSKKNIYNTEKSRKKVEEPLTRISNKIQVSQKNVSVPKKAGKRLDVAGKNEKLTSLLGMKWSGVLAADDIFGGGAGQGQLGSFWGWACPRFQIFSSFCSCSWRGTCAKEVERALFVTVVNCFLFVQKKPKTFENVPMRKEGRIKVK